MERVFSRRPPAGRSLNLRHVWLHRALPDRSPDALGDLEAITQKRDVANMRSAASSCNNLAKHWPLLGQTIALSAAEIPRFGVLASNSPS